MLACVGKFGTDAASKCEYQINFISLRTPSSIFGNKYPSDYGLGDCDPPIEIQSLVNSRFPGVYTFRVYTFISGNPYVNIPTESDVYSITVDPLDFSSLSATVVSN